MKTIRLAVAAAVVATFAVLASAPAQAYPGLQCNVSDAEVEGGDDVKVKITVDPDVNSKFTLKYQGEERDDSGTSFTTEFDTPEVNEDTETTVFGTVTQNGNTAECTGAILLEDGDGNDGDGNDDDGNGASNGDGGGLLPDTGGERIAWLIIGGLLVLVGGGVVLASRRRDTDLT